MYKKELDNLIAANKLPKSIMLYGECEYLTSLYTKKISLIFGKKEDILAFYFDEYDFKSAKNFLSQSSLFGGKNILLIKRVLQLNGKIYGMVSKMVNLIILV